MRRPRETYLDMWHKYGETPIRANQPPQCDRLDEIVYNAAKRVPGRASRRSRHKHAADPAQPADFRMDKTELAKKAIYEIGGNYQAIAVYDEAAKWYEKYADLKPTPEKADVALSDAVQLRLGLGQADEAIKDAAAFRAKFGGSKPTQTAQIAVCHRRALRFDRSLGTGENDAPRGHGTARQGAAGHPGTGPRDPGARLFAEQSRAGRRRG